MKNILLVTSSPRGEDSYSTLVAKDLVRKLRSEFPNATLTVRDLSQSPPPVLDPSGVQAIRATSDEGLSESQLRLRALADEFTDELFAADLLVVASGMINFGVSSVLKAWIDLIARAGVTFRYTAEGPVGLLAGRKAYLVLASGNVYGEGPLQSLDHQAPFLRDVLSFLGIEVVETIRVEGVGFGPETAEAAIDSARHAIEELSTAA